jgi:general stress protein 26
MDSINKNQPEENFKAIAGKEAVQKLQEMGKEAPTCFFCTKMRKGQSFSTRPMSVQQVDDEGNFWFLSAADSYKNEELKGDKSVQLLFQESKYSDFLTIYGKAKVSKSKDKIKELWNPILKTWFTEGENDPRITVIKVTPQNGYYWDTKHGKLVAMVKTVAGAISGKTFDDSIEGPVKL